MENFKLIFKTHAHQHIGEVELAVSKDAVYEMLDYLSQAIAEKFLDSAIELGPEPEEGGSCETHACTSCGETMCAAHPSNYASGYDASDYDASDYEDVEYEEGGEPASTYDKMSDSEFDKMLRKLADYIGVPIKDLPAHVHMEPANMSPILDEELGKRAVTKAADVAVDFLRNMAPVEVKITEQPKAPKLKFAGVAANVEAAMDILKSNSGNPADMDEKIATLAYIHRVVDPKLTSYEAYQKALTFFTR